MSSSHLQLLLPQPAAGGYALGCGQQAEAGPSSLLSVYPSAWLSWRPHMGQIGLWSLSSTCLVLDRFCNIYNGCPPSSWTTTLLLQPKPILSTIHCHLHMSAPQLAHIQYTKARPVLSSPNTSLFFSQCIAINLVQQAKIWSFKTYSSIFSKSWLCSLWTLSFRTHVHWPLQALQHSSLDYPGSLLTDFSEPVIGTHAF